MSQNDGFIIIKSVVFKSRQSNSQLVLTGCWHVISGYSLDNFIFMKNQTKLIGVQLNLNFSNLTTNNLQIYMSLVQNNPFNKPNPFKLTHYDKFHHAHLPTNHPADYAHLVYHDPQKLHHSRAITNNWVFNDNNLSKRGDFGRKYELSKSQVSEFQLHMKVSAVYNHPKNPTKIIEYKNKQGKLQNPFHRKNLIIDKHAVVNQVEADLSIYRNKSNTTYEQPALRVSFGTNNGADQSPIIRSKYSQQKRYEEKDKYVVQQTRIPEVIVDSPNPLTYSKTPQMTQRESNRQKEYVPPKTIQFKRKTFFLNSTQNN